MGCGRGEKLGLEFSFLFLDLLLLAHQGWVLKACWNKMGAAVVLQSACAFFSGSSPSCLTSTVKGAGIC